MLRKALMICAITGALGMGVVPAMARIYVSIAPPAPVVETPAPAPGPGYVWTPGYYNWNGSSYVWVGGSWLLPPHHRAHWAAGAWVHGRRGYYYRAGHWRG